jgi:hypothetical protein
MTSQSPRIYIYKITFEEVQYYYYGVHKEKRFDEYYMGSPKTHKWCWDFYTPKKQILEFFEFNDEGWLEAQEVEKRIIRPVYNTDKWCLNESCGGIISLEMYSNGGKKVKELGLGIFGLTPEQKSENSRRSGKKGGKIGGKIGGKKAKELRLGVHGRTKEQMTEDGKKGGKISGEKTKELGLGIHGLTQEQRCESSRKGGKIGGKIGGKKAKKLGVGVHGRTKEQMVEHGRKGGKIGGKKSKELGVGLHGLTPEQTSENGRKGGNSASKITNSQKWMCLETGFVTNPGNLTKYQKKRDIDTSKRIRIL